MKKVLLIISTILFISSCSAPADKWSCSKLYTEIEKAEQQIVYAGYHREQSIISAEQYKERVKAFEDAIAYYKGRLKYCKETVETPSKAIEAESENMVKDEAIKKEELVIDNQIEGIEGEWKSSSSDVLVAKIAIKKAREPNYDFTFILIDGSRMTKTLKLNSSNEYQTGNQWGEYYKLSGNTLTAYDNDGYLFSLQRVK